MFCSKTVRGIRPLNRTNDRKKKRPALVSEARWQRRKARICYCGTVQDVEAGRRFPWNSCHLHHSIDSWASFEVRPLLCIFRKETRKTCSVKVLICLNPVRACRFSRSRLWGWSPASPSERDNLVLIWAWLSVCPTPALALTQNQNNITSSLSGQYQ